MQSWRFLKATLAAALFGAVPLAAQSAPVTIEAESMSLSSYVVESGTFYGTLIRTANGASSGTATKGFPGATGTYDIEVQVVAENDGRPTLDVYKGAALLKTFTYPLASSPSSRASFTIPGVAVASGETIKLVGRAPSGTFARIDRVVFNPRVGPVTIEAESMSLSSYVVESGTAYGTLIRTANGASAATATKTFPGAAGTYDIEVQVVAESDGRPTLEVYKGATLLKTFTYPLASSPSSRASFTIPGVAVGSGETIKLVGRAPAGTFARVDKTVFNPAGASTAAPTTPKPPMVIGISTHFGFGVWNGGWRTDPDLFRTWNAEAGLTSSRDNMFWSHVESTQGILRMRDEPLNTQTVWNSMPASFAPLLVLAQSNRYYDSGGQPKSDAAVSAFTRYADWVVGQTPRIRFVEVWNEWDLRMGASSLGGSQGDPVDYARLAQATGRQLKASRPGVKVLVGAMGTQSDWIWTSAAIQAGMLTYADGISVHIYNHCASPQNVGADRAIARADDLRRLLDSMGKAAVPIYVTETGWPTNIGNCPVTEEDSAVHTARFLVEASLRDWLAGVWIYEMQDGGTDLTAREQNFGVTRYVGTEKPSGCAMRELATTIAKRPKSVTRASGVTMARFANGTSDRWILWASQDKVYSVGDAQVRLASQSGSALPQPTEVCTVTGGTLSGATATLYRKNLFVLDLPASETIAMQPLN
jgi:hypothetical protein